MNLKSLMMTIMKTGLELDFNSTAYKKTGDFGPSFLCIAILVAPIYASDPLAVFSSRLLALVCSGIQ